MEHPSPGVVRVLLDRPEVHNAQTSDMWRRLAEISGSLPDGTRVVVLSGRGPSFSAGLDTAVVGELAGLGARPAAELDASIAGYQEAFTGWRRPGVLSVAVVAGHAIGAGFQLALSCDLRIAADDVSFAMAETGLGLVPDLGGTGPLVRAVGEAAAVEICLTGRRVGAADALRLGLVQLVVERAELDGAVDDLLQAVLAAPRGASTATLDLLRGAGARPQDEQLARERRSQGDRLRSLPGEAAGPRGR